MHASRNTIEQMKGFELKEELEERRLLSTGLKADLIQRLMQNEVWRKLGSKKIEIKGRFS